MSQQHRDTERTKVFVQPLTANEQSHYQEATHLFVQGTYDFELLTLLSLSGVESGWRNGRHLCKANQLFVQQLDPPNNHFGHHQRGHHGAKVQQKHFVSRRLRLFGIIIVRTLRFFFCFNQSVKAC